MNIKKITLEDEMLIAMKEGKYKSTPNGFKKISRVYKLTTRDKILRFFGIEVVRVRLM